MKLKRRHLVKSIKFLDGFKGFIFLGLLLIGSFLKAQEVSVSATDATGSEVTVPAPPNTATFTFSHNGIFSPGVQVNYSVSGTATPNSDYTSLTGSVNLVTGSAIIQATQNSIDIVLSGIVDDDLVELQESVIITITSVVGGFGSPTISPTQNSAQATINNGDMGTFTITAVDANAVEETPSTPGGSGSFLIELDKENVTGTTVTLPYSIGGSANLGAAMDYTIIGETVLNFPAGTFSKTLQVQPNDDILLEDDETVIITLGNPSNNLLFQVGTPNSGTVTIFDNDCLAGDIAPVLDNEPTSLCDVVGVDLSTFYSGSVPVGAQLRWSLLTNPTEAQLLSGTAVTQAGSNTYYAFFVAGTGSTFCTSPSSAALTITLNDSPSPGTTTNVSACNNADPAFTPRIIDLDNVITGEDAGSWSQSGGPSVGTIPNSNMINFDNRPAGVYEFTYTTTGAVAPCTNSSSSVTITVTDCDPCTAGNVAPVLNSNPTIFCGPIPDNVTLNDYAPNTGPSNNPLKWSSSQTDPITNIVQNAVVQNPQSGTYYGFYHDETNDCASPVVALTLESKLVPTVDSTSGAERCGPGLVTLTASVSINATINWYASATSNIVLGSGTSLMPNVLQTTSYWVEATLNDCPSGREEVIATVIPQPSAGTIQNGGNASACSNKDNGPTIVDLDELITGEDPGIWVFTNGPVGENINILPDNSIDFENKSDGDYIFTYTTTGAQAPCSNESSSITISINDCDVDTDMDGLFDGPEAILGTNPNNPDSDGDGIDDSEEVGADIDNPLDEDDDGIIDALDSNIIDTDMDGVVDQLDPANENPCLPNRFNGSCDTDGDGISDLDEQTNGSDPDDPCDPNATPDCDVPIDLEILKVVNNENAVVGDEVEFTITVTNLDATRKARSIKIGDILESGFEYVADDPSTGSYNVDMGEWVILELEPLAVTTLTITVLIIDGATYTNTATLLESIPEDITEDNNEATAEVFIEIPEGIDLVLEKTALSPNPLVNDEVIFTLKISNASIDELPVTNIEVEDFISDDSGFVYLDHNTLTGEYDRSTGIWSIESLNRGQEVTLEIRVRVPSEGRFSNTAQIRRSSPADGNLENNESTVEVNVSLPSPADVGFLFNQFSPNGDGTNDVLKINKVNRESNFEESIIYNIQIFNRYGNLVFEGNNKTDSEVWDGTWKGKDAPDGTYFYTMSIDIGNGPEPKKGWIQLIR